LLGGEHHCVTGAIRRSSSKKLKTNTSHGAVRPHFDVRGLEVAMDDAPLMSRFQRLGDLFGDRQRLAERDGTARGSVGEI